MRKTTVFLMAAAIVAFTACSSGVNKTAHGVKVAAGDGTTVRVEVVTDDIIHVEAVPKGAKFSKKESLMVVPQEYKASYTVEKTGDAVQIRTETMLVTVSKADGRVQYARVRSCKVPYRGQCHRHPEHFRSPHQDHPA